MENTNDRPVEIDSYDYRTWHLLEEEKPTAKGEYLVTVSTDYFERKEYRHVDIWWWTGNDFCKPDCMGIPEAHVIAWTEMPTPCMGGCYSMTFIYDVLLIVVVSLHSIGCFRVGYHYGKADGLMEKHKEEDDT